MATAYPGSLDSWSNPTATTPENQSGLEHHVLHSNHNDAIEAIEGELGTDPAGGAATVKARLDLMGFPRPLNWPSTGLNHLYSNGPSLLNSTATVTANRLYFHPFWCPTSVTTTHLCVITGAMTVGNVRVGIYSDSYGSTGHLPGSLLIDAGTASTNSFGVKSITCSQSLAGDTLYWMASVFDAAATSVYGFPTGANYAHAVNGWDNSSSTPQLGLVYQAHTYGALPASASGLSYSGGAFIPGVWVRL